MLNDFFLRKNNDLLRAHIKKITDEVKAKTINKHLIK